MRLTPNMELVLRAVLADAQRLASVPDRPARGVDRDVWRGQYLERHEARQYGVRHDLERWLGCPPSRSDSAVFSRVLRSMESLGLVVRISRWGRGRTTHVILTPAGERVARELAGAEALEPEEPLDLNSVKFEPIYLPEEGDRQ